ncbi:MAG: type II toxin-antitoxin system Phd/YefM family antitoxin [Candidatus Rokubacteria bacterium]|nr:type II toxin-antitoxin system Phd/YefM family antitoxin [Candidatus Rokubacteria bacterium]
MLKASDIIPVTDLRQDAAAALKRVRATKQPHERQILLLLARGERESRAGKGHDLDKVLGEADRLLADA